MIIPVPTTTHSQQATSFILSETARCYDWEGQSALSIKSFFAGRALYTVGPGYCAVDDNSYLVLDRDQPYRISIEAEAEVESFCLFFAPGFAEEVKSSLVSPDERLLDSPGVSEPLAFVARTHRHDRVLSPLLMRLRAQIAEKRYEEIWLQEQFHALMQALLQVQHNVYREMEALPAVRATTREELYRRLYMAREYAVAFFDTALTLPELAAVAALSPNHFLRMFKQLFHQTPHQYLTAVRLERAQYLLASTEHSVTEICYEVGFASPGSFSWLFHRRVGCAPLVYRRRTKG